MLHQILHITKQELSLELKQKNTLYGLLLYMLCLVFMVYMLQGEPEPLQWNVLVWLSSLFIVMNSVAKQFGTDTKARWLYYYITFHPAAYISAKIIYNIILILFLSLLMLLLFKLFMGYPPIKPQLFFGLFILGNVSMSILFTFLSNLVTRINGTGATLAIIGFPLVFPLIIMLSDLSVISFQPMHIQGWQGLFAALLALDIIVICLSIVLFPFVWRD
jgi:heme exporter protein B